MKLALHGYGKMGHAIEKVAAERGHQVTAIYDSKRHPALGGAEVMIDFSQAPALEQAIEICSGEKIPLVIGTTGWNDRMAEVKERIERAGIAAVYAANFSPGATVTFALARRAGELFARFPQYAAGMEERHHAQKKDAPSGTALRIASEVREGSEGRLDPAIAASRVGSEYGLHTVFFDSPDDLVEISHRARGRDGFARGAVMAAEMIRGRKGFYRFDELVMS
ncbi:MAG TPA: dihydrodipicolinate reductase C-terminal domain-containing protein [Thermoanaerobaculia bacterium]|nr:dihydrodipicolinate reductase C-terminal domain-containing protein [Thermoanaerobaculia bacterium]